MDLKLIILFFKFLSVFAHISDQYPDYLKSIYFSGRFHFALSNCSRDYRQLTDPSYELFLQNKLTVHHELDDEQKEERKKNPWKYAEYCFIACIIKSFGLSDNSKGYLLSLNKLGTQLRRTLRRTFPHWLNSIGYYMFLAAWCFPQDQHLSQSYDDCEKGVCLYNCVQEIRNRKKMKYDIYNLYKPTYDGIMR